MKPGGGPLRPPSELNVYRHADRETDRLTEWFYWLHFAAKNGQNFWDNMRSQGQGSMAI